MKKYFLLGFLLISFLHVKKGFAQFEYISPKPNSIYHNTTTNIILKNGALIDSTSLSDSLFTVTGTLSGNHTVTLILSDDKKTILIYTQLPFSQGETVTVTVDSAIKKQTGEIIAGTRFQFQTHPAFTAGRQAEMKNALEKIYSDERGLNQLKVNRSQSDSIPLPQYEITSTGKEFTGDAFFYNFKSTIPGDQTDDYQFRTILKDSGDSVYAVRNNNAGIDFKINHNGYLTYYNEEDSGFEMMDSNYRVIDSFFAGNGYQADNHEFQIFPDGHCFFLSYDVQVLNMKLYYPNGDTAANVTGTILQELDKNKHVVFEWRSWDNFAINDSYIDANNIHDVDLVHGNAIEIDADSNILLSSRHLSEITKIDHNTGGTIWRWGGKNNQFTFINDTVNRNQFYYQHDIRRLPNGNYSLFNNNNTQPTPSSAKEYTLDPINKTATLKWIFIRPPIDDKKLNSNAMGNVQLLPNGDRFICWGLIAPTDPPAPMPNFTEVDSLGNIVWEFRFTGNEGYFSYRAFKFNWERCGAPLPESLAISDITSKSANFSWGVPSYASQFEFDYKTDSSTEWTSFVTADHSYFLTDLMPETVYDWRIRTVCTVFNDSSEYSPIQKFNTIASTISQSAGTNFYFYPNPASDRLRLNFDLQKSSTVTFFISNVIGEAIYSKQWTAKEGFNSNEIYLPALSSGIYFTNFKSNTGEAHKQLVIR
ncbi:MAG: aryl-sulfate sulfotransferase [Chitinophagales bacterium]|nr:aryl-sulfate sulfotransferase [Chitinophagales bacterium]